MNFQLAQNFNKLYISHIYLSYQDRYILSFAKLCKIIIIIPYLMMLYNNIKSA